MINSIPMNERVQILKYNGIDEWNQAQHVPGDLLWCFMNLKGGLITDNDGYSSGVAGSINRNSRNYEVNGHLYVAYNNDITHLDKVRLIDAVGKPFEREIKEVNHLRNFGLGKYPLLTKIVF